MARRGWLPLGALGFILAVTAAWWVVALWPLPDAAPEWLLRTRAICFGAAPTGLPDTAGWTALILQPLLMLSLLWVAWGESVITGLRSLCRSAAGRSALAAVGFALLAGFAGVGWRVSVSSQRDALAAEVTAPSPSPASYPRLDLPAPSLRLVNQHGDTVSLHELRGRIAFVTFAYAHCTTVCPLIVHEALRAREAASELDPALWVVTLDPWRDTPSRLPHIARSWSLPDDAFVLSGAADAVNELLDGWNVARSRDPLTGEIVHPNLVYLVDRAGRIAYASVGNARLIASLARRL